MGDPRGLALTMDSEEPQEGMNTTRWDLEGSLLRL